MARKRPDETRLDKAFRVMNEATYRFADDPSDANRDALIAAVKEKRAALRDTATIDIEIEEGKPPKARVIVAKGTNPPPVIVPPTTNIDDIVEQFRTDVNRDLEELFNDGNTEGGARSSEVASIPPEGHPIAGASAA